jgi:hypothetical protein
MKKGRQVARLGREVAATVVMGMAWARRAVCGAIMFTTSGQSKRKSSDPVEFVVAEPRREDSQQREDRCMGWALPWTDLNHYLDADRL